MFNPYAKEIKGLEKGKLSEAEKAEIRSALVSYMEFYPVREFDKSRLFTHRSILTVSFFKKSMPVALIIALLLSGSVSFAAERSLPGDMLYPVKVNVNEEVRSALTFKAEDKAALEAKFAERRLEEAEKLALAGEAKADVIAKLEEKFNDHANKIEDKIAKLEEKGNDEAAERLSSALEVSLDVHDRVLAALSASSTATSSAKLMGLGRMVKDRADKVEKLHNEVENDNATSTKEAALGKIGAAENKLESTKKFVELKTELLSKDDLSKVNAKIASSSSAIAKAKDLVSHEKYAEAFLKAKEAMDLAQEAKVAVMLHIDLDLRVNLKAMFKDHSTTTGTSTDDRDDKEDKKDKEDRQDDKDKENRGRGRLELNLNL